MNGIINFVRFITYSVAAVAVRKSWNWFTKDLDPIPGTKEFNQEWVDTEAKYKRLRKKKEEQNDTSRKIR